MIARIWHGTTQIDKADEYVDYLNKTGIRGLPRDAQEMAELISCGKLKATRRIFIL